MFILTVNVADVLIASNAAVAAKHRQDLSRTAYVFVMKRINIEFVETSRPRVTLRLVRCLWRAAIPVTTK